MWSTKSHPTLCVSYLRELHTCREESCKEMHRHIMEVQSQTGFGKFQTVLHFHKAHG